MEDNFMMDKASSRSLEALSACLPRVRAEASLRSTTARGMK